MSKHRQVYKITKYKQELKREVGHFYKEITTSFYVIDASNNM
jgi:hypothetical protein